MSKLSGVPWVMETIPFNDIPTMIVGIDIFHKANKPSVLSICCTFDSRFSKYISYP